MNAMYGVGLCVVFGAAALFAVPRASAQTSSAQQDAGSADREWRFIEKLREDGMEDLALRQLEAFARDFADDPRAPRALMDAARGESSLGKPVAARELAEDLLARFPSSPEAPSAALLRADQLRDEGRQEEAAAAYRDLLGAYPDAAEADAARLGLGEALMSAGNDDDARRLFRGLVSETTADGVAAHARFDLGVLELRAGEEKLAIERFDSIHLQYPGEAIGAFGLVRAAELLAAREEYAAAEDRYQKVIDSYDRPVLRSRARLGLARLLEEKDSRRAVGLYRAVVEEGAATGDLKSAYLGLGRSALASGDEKTAGSISTAFLERFPDAPEADRARLIRARALLVDEPPLGVEALESLSRASDADVAWSALKILADRARESGDPEQVAIRWRQAEAVAQTPERRALALVEQAKVARRKGQTGLAADLGLLAAETADSDTLAARGLQIAASARASARELQDAIDIARQCTREYPLTPAASWSRANLSVWTRMTSADPSRAASELASLALAPFRDPAARSIEVGKVQRDLLGDYSASRKTFERALESASDPGTASRAGLELARTAQLAALDAGLRGEKDDARSRLREARTALVEVAARAGTPELASRGRLELLGLDLADAARPAAPWLFDPRGMPLLGAVGPVEQIDVHGAGLDATRDRILAALDGTTGDIRAWLAWRAAELSPAGIDERLGLVEEGMRSTKDTSLLNNLRFTRGQLQLLADRPAEAARDLAEIVRLKDQPDLSLAARYGLAEAQRKLKRYEQAAELYDDFAAAWPDTRRGQRAMLLSGDCALFAGRTDDAVTRYRQLLDRYPNSLYADDALYRLGTALEREGKLEAARRPLWKLVEDSGASEYRGRALARLGRLEVNAGEDAPAVKVYERLTTADPARAVEEHAWENLARLELRLGNPDRALHWARSGPEDSGDSARRIALEVESLAALGRGEEAARRLDALSLSHPDRPEEIATARIAFASSLVKSGNDEVARAQFERAAGETGNAELRARAAWELGKIAVRSQRWADARSSFETARDLAPKSEWAAEALFKLGQIYLRESEPAASRQAFDTLARNFPDHPRAVEALRAEAQVWIQEGRYDEALKLYHRILEQYPDAPDGPGILSRIAYCHHEMRQYELAIAAYTRVMPLLDPEGQAYAQFWIADSQDQLGRYEESAAGFLRIPYLHPELGQLGVTARLKAGEAWEHKGDTGAAREIYERVLAAQGAGTQWGDEAARRLERLGPEKGE